MKMHRAWHSQKHAPSLPFPFPRGSTNKSPSSARAASRQSPVARTCPRRPTSERRTRSTGTASLEPPRPQARVLTLTLRLTLTCVPVPVPVSVHVHVHVRFLGTSNALPHHPCAIRPSAHPSVALVRVGGDSRAACAPQTPALRTPTPTRRPQRSLAIGTPQAALSARSPQQRPETATATGLAERVTRATRPRDSPAVSRSLRATSCGDSEEAASGERRARPGVPAAAGRVTRPAGHSPLAAGRFFLRVSGVWSLESGVWCHAPRGRKCVISAAGRHTSTP